MAWVRLEPNMPRHPKLVAAGPLGFALDVAAICYSNEYGTDGFIADGVLVSVLPGLKKAKLHAQKLVDVGRWERDDISGGWWVHDADHYQPTAQETEAERAKARERMRALRAKRSGSVRANTSECSGDVRDPVPNRTEPYRTDPLVENHQASLSHREDGSERDARVIAALGLLADEDLTNAQAVDRVRVPAKYRAQCLRTRIADDGSDLDDLASDLPDLTPEQLVKEHLQRRFLA